MTLRTKPPVYRCERCGRKVEWKRIDDKNAQWNCPVCVHSYGYLSYEDPQEWLKETAPIQGRLL